VNDADQKPHQLWRLDFFAMFALGAAFLAWNLEFRPVADRCARCDADLAAYRQLTEKYGTVGDSYYLRQIEDIYWRNGLRYDAARQYRINNDAARPSAKAE
jgi:hypothetical protein